MLMRKSPKNPRQAARVTPAVGTEFLPRSLIAGSLPLAKDAVPAQVAYNAASFALDSERICLIIAVKGARVHYLAGAASDFASQSGAVCTALACALPGSPFYRGPGVYFSPVGDDGLTACVIGTDDNVKCFVGAEVDALRFQESEQMADLPVVRLASSVLKLATLPPWRPFNECERDSSQRLLVRLRHFGIGYCAAMVALWVATAVYAAAVDDRVQNSAAQAQALIASAQQAMAEDGGMHHPAWQELQTISRFVLEHQGRVTAFEAKAGKINWALDVPDFVTGDEIGKAFGSGIQTRKEGARIHVTKNKATP